MTSNRKFHAPNGDNYCKTTCPSQKAVTSGNSTSKPLPTTFWKIPPIHCGTGQPRTGFSQAKLCSPSLNTLDGYIWILTLYLCSRLVLNCTVSIKGSVTFKVIRILKVLILLTKIIGFTSLTSKSIHMRQDWQTFYVITTVSMYYLKIDNKLAIPLSPTWIWQEFRKTISQETSNLPTITITGASITHIDDLSTFKLTLFLYTYILSYVHIFWFQFFIFIP